MNTNTYTNSHNIPVSKTMIAILFFCFCFANHVNAQDSSLYKKFRIDFSLTVSVTDKKLDGLQSLTGTVMIEPTYALSDNFALGIRYMNVNSFSYNGTDVSTKNNNIYFATATVRSNPYHSLPFETTNRERLTASLAIGINRYTNKIDTTFLGLPFGQKLNTSATSFAFMPRIAYEYGKFTTEINYTYTGNSGANFIGIGLGCYFGGGRKKK